MGLQKDCAHPQLSGETVWIITVIRKALLLNFDDFVIFYFVLLYSSNLSIHVYIEPTFDFCLKSSIKVFNAPDIFAAQLRM